MRILLINKFHYLKGGAERAYFDTARILSENGHTVAFFSMEHPENLPTPWSRFFVSRSEYLAVGEPPSWRARFRLACRILWNREANAKLEALIEEFRPDIAHLHNFYHQLSPSILWTLKKRRVPMVMTLHDYKIASPNYNLFLRGRIWEHASGFRCLADRCVKNSLSKSVICVLEKWLHGILGSYGLIDRFISPSQFLINEMKELGVNRNIVKIPQPLLPFPESAPSPVHGPLLFYGRLSEEKGVALLLAAMEMLPNETLVIAGTGPDEARLREIKASQKLEGVTFVGYKTGEDLEALIHAAKAIVIPSLWFENMPYVLVEALARGKVVFASRLGGLSERMRDGDNGFLFEAGKANDLSQKIRSLSPKMIQSIGEKAQESVKDLQPSSYYTALSSLYSEILGKLTA